MGSSELKTFSLSASFVEASERAGSAVCLHVLCVLSIHLCQTGALLSCCKSLSGLSSPPQGLIFFFHAPFAGVTKRQQTSSAEEITSFLLDVSHESHAPERQTQ